MQRKKFRIKIRAFGYSTDYTTELDKDSVEAVHDDVLDKIGKNTIIWRSDEFYDKRKCYLTYEEV